VTDMYHVCYQRFCENCKQDRDVNHMSYMRPLKNALPVAGDKVLYVFYYFETTQNIKCHDNKASLHVPNLLCVQQFCSAHENEEEDVGDCARCGKRKHSFWDDPAGDLISYLCKSRPWADKVVAIAHNAKAFDLHFILNRAIMLR
jgi:hypothetical protein